VCLIDEDDAMIVKLLNDHVADSCFAGGSTAGNSYTDVNRVHLILELKH